LAHGLPPPNSKDALFYGVILLGYVVVERVSITT
jgi:hypothetical protein